MISIYKDEDYLEIVNDILTNNEFKKIKILEHHGVTRYEHSLKVSYTAYKLSKFFKLDHIATARGGLLHDFFFTDNQKSSKERFVSVFNHPSKAVENAKQTFTISAKEANAIESHMFFINPSKLPKYTESWLVILADTIIGGYELSFNLKNKAVAYASLWLLFILNYNH